MILHKIIPFPPLLPSPVLERVNTVCVKYNFYFMKVFRNIQDAVIEALISFTVSTDNTFAGSF